MVKKQRAITPPEDANYFTVNNPYPLHFEWEIEEEVIKHARWIVACLGTSEPFWAYHYKKSVPAIILEIAKSKDGVWMKKLLGEHQWQDVLRHPNKDENGCASQIFSCRHQNSLAMINDGWCRVAIQAKWLENWSPEDDFQVNPYPRPTYCEPPHLDRTNLPLSLRLPSKFGPPRPEIAHSKQVPGSNAWVGTQGDRSQINNSPRGGGSRVRGVTRKGSAAAQRPASSGPTWNQPIFESSPQMSITRIPEKLPQARTVKTSTSSSQLPPRSTHHVPANTLSLDNYGPPPGLSQGIVELTESDEELENIVLGSKEHTMQENDSAEYAGLSDEPEVWGGYLVQAKKQTDEPICPVHRRICKRAICSTYDDIIRKRDKQLKKEGKEPLNKVGPYNAKQGEKEFRKRQEAELEKKKEEGKNKQRDLARRRNSSKGTDAAPKRQEKTATLPSGQNDPPAPPPAITSMEDDSEDDPFEDDQPTITEVATHPPTSNRLVWSDEVEKEFGSIHTEDSDESDPEPW